MRPVLGILLLAAFVAAGDVARPLVFFRSPDKKTEKWIKNELISGNGIGAGTVRARSLARAELEVLDAWAVPYLGEALYGRKKVRAHTVRMNAAATLARILDPRALPELRGAAASDDDRWVQRTALLGLGLFRQREDVDLFAANLDLRPEKRRDACAALGLGKLPASPTAANALLARLAKPPRDEHLTAALLLASAIRTDETPVLDFLAHKKRVVQHVAAACLQIRPLAPDRIEPLLKQIRRGRFTDVRAMQFHALAAMPERTDAIRAELLDCAVKTKYKAGARVAALIGLAHEWGKMENYERLAKLYRGVQNRNDEVVAALMFAMVRTGDPRAVKSLLHVVKTGSDFLRFYAAGALFHLIALGPEEIAGADQIASEIERQRSRTEDKRLLELIDLVGRWRSPPEGTTDRRALARDGLKRIGDPRDLHLFDWTREERAWAIVNSMVPLILQLDKLLGAMSEPDTSGQKPQPKPGSGGKEEAGSEEELDLLDWLQEQPYYVPEDLG
ncbi:MAG: HEAT repeat domain-containing protein [Planctomycetota bacterium]